MNLFQNFYVEFAFAFVRFTYFFYVLVNVANRPIPSVNFKFNRGYFLLVHNLFSLTVKFNLGSAFSKRLAVYKRRHH